MKRMRTLSIEIGSLTRSIPVRNTRRLWGSTPRRSSRLKSKKKKHQDNMKKNKGEMEKEKLKLRGIPTC